MPGGPLWLHVPPHMIVGQSEVWSRGCRADMDLPGIMTSLFANLLKCPSIASWLRRLLLLCAECIDEAVAQDEVHSARPTPDAIAHPRGHKRSRRLDVDLVAYAAVDIVARKRFRSAASAARGLGIMQPRRAHDTEETFMSRYLAASYESLQNRCFYFLSMDGGRLGGKERLFTACWSHDGQIAAWLVPQVFWRPAGHPPSRRLHIHNLGG